MTHVFALDDGQVVTGFVVTEAADKVTIRERSSLIDYIESLPKQQ